MFFLNCAGNHTITYTNKKYVPYISVLELVLSLKREQFLLCCFQNSCKHDIKNLALLVDVVVTVKTIKFKTN